MNYYKEMLIISCDTTHLFRCFLESSHRIPTENHGISIHTIADMDNQENLDFLDKVRDVVVPKMRSID